MKKTEEGIFYSKKNVFSDNKIDPHLEADAEEHYTLSDIKDNIQAGDTKNIFAKKVTRKNGSTKFLVRLDSNGKLFNPLSILGQEPERSFLNRVCRSNTKFTEVNKKTFDWYIQFLSSRNIAWLNNAERERE